MGHGRALGRLGRARDGPRARAGESRARAVEARARALGRNRRAGDGALARARWPTNARPGVTRGRVPGGNQARPGGHWRARGGGARARARWGSGARAVVTRARARGWHRGARARRYHPQKASYAWYFDAIFCRHAQKNVKIASAKFQNFLTSFFIYLIFQR